MPSSNFPYGFAQGFSVRGMPLLQAQPGKARWVNNNTTVASGNSAGADGNPGTFNQPLATLQRALNLSTSGDMIIVGPGHAENLPDAATLLFNQAGVAIVGLGSGSLRPTFNFTTANTANIPVTAADMSIQNCVFISKFLNVASVFTATGTATPTNFAVQNCEFRDSSAILTFVAIVTGNATANSLDGLQFVGNAVYGIASSPAAATTAVVLASATDRAKANDNYIVHAVTLVDTAVLLAGGANNMTNLEVARNKVFRPSTSTTGHLLSSSSTACSGYVYDNYAWHLDNSAALLAPTGTKLGFQNNYCMITGAADKSGLINPAAV